MKEFDAFENSMKDAMEGFKEIKPSKKLWWRISGSLIVLAFLNNSYIHGLLITVIGVVGVGWIISTTSQDIKPSTIAETNTHINNTDNNNANSNISTPEFYLENNATSNSSSINPTNNANTNAEYDNNTINTTEKANNSNNKTAAAINTQTSVNNNNLLQDDQNKHSTIAKTTLPTINNSAIEPIENYSSQKLNNEKPISATASNTSIIASNSAHIKNIKNSEAKQESNNPLDNTSENTTHKTKSKTASNEEVPNSDILKYDVTYAPSIETDIAIMTVLNPNDIKIRHISPKKTRLFYNYEFVVGPSLSYSQFELNPNNISDKEINKHSSKMDYHFGGNINIHKNDWFIRTGIGFNQYSEDIEYTTTSIKIDSTVFLYNIINHTYNQTIVGWNTNIGNGLDSIPIYTQTVTTTSSQNKITEYDSLKKVNTIQYRNTYSMINIPLLVGREFDYESFVFDIAGGISWTHITKASSNILDAETGKVLSIDQDYSNMHKDIFNGVLSLGAGYKYNRANIIFIRPEVHYNFNSIFDKQYFDKHKMYQLRFSVGLRYKIR